MRYKTYRAPGMSSPKIRWGRVVLIALAVVGVGAIIKNHIKR